MGKRSFKKYLKRMGYSVQHESGYLFKFVRDKDEFFEYLYNRTYGKEDMRNFSKLELALK